MTDEQPYAKGIQGLLKRLERLDELDEAAQLQTCKDTLDACCFVEHADLEEDEDDD